MKKFLLTTVVLTLLVSCGKQPGGNKPHGEGNAFPEEEIKAYLVERGQDISNYYLPIELKQSQLLSYENRDYDEDPHFNVTIQDDDEFSICHTIINTITSNGYFEYGDFYTNNYRDIYLEIWPEGHELYMNIYAGVDFVDTPEQETDFDYNKTASFRLQNSDYIGKNLDLNNYSNTFDGFTFSFSKNGGQTTPKSEKSNAVYLYTDNQLEIKRTQALIRKIEFTVYTADPKRGELSPDSGKVTVVDDITTWECKSNVNKVTFTALAQYRFELMTIYYYEDEHPTPILGLKTIAEVYEAASDTEVPVTNNGWYLTNVEVTVNVKAIDAIDSVSTSDGLDGGARGKVLCVDSTGYIICSSGVSKNNPIDFYQRVKDYIKAGTTTYTVTGHIAFFNGVVEIKVETYEYKSTLIVDYDLNNFVTTGVWDGDTLFNSCNEITTNPKGYGVGHIVRLNEMTYFKKYNSAGSYYFLDTARRLVPVYSLLDKDRSKLQEGHVYDIIGLESMYLGRPSLRILEVKNSEAEPRELNLDNFIYDIEDLSNLYHINPNQNVSEYYHSARDLYRASVYISRYADDKYIFNTSYYYDRIHFNEYTTGASQADAASRNAIGVFNEDLDYKGTFADYVLENCSSEEECEDCRITIYFTLAFLDTVGGKQMWRAYILEGFINYPEA